MVTPTLTVVGRPDGVVAFVCGAFCVWWLLFVVPFACMACMCAWRCALPAWRPTNTKLHPTLENGTAIFWRSCANWFWLFFLCCIQLSTTSRKFTLLSYPLLHLFCITSAVLQRCFVASALLRRCFCVASALPPRCVSVASAHFLNSLGFGVALAACAATSVQLRCNFRSTLAQQCILLNQNLTASCSDAHLCDLRVACSLQDEELLRTLNTFRCFNHERHNNTCLEVYFIQHCRH